MTLEVTQKQAEMIAVASEMGRMSLSLRSLPRDENKPDRRRGMTLDSEVSLALPTPARYGRHITVVRGGKVEQVPITRGAR